MSTSLYDLSVPNYLQILGGISGVMQKGADYAESTGMELEDIIALRLREDMAPFSFQVISVWHHSLGAVRGIKDGLFQPPPKLGELSYAD